MTPQHDVPVMEARLHRAKWNTKLSRYGGLSVSKIIAQNDNGALLDGKLLQESPQFCARLAIHELLFRRIGVPVQLRRQLPMRSAGSSVERFSLGRPFKIGTYFERWSRPINTGQTPGNCIMQCISVLVVRTPIPGLISEHIFFTEPHVMEVRFAE